MPHFSPPLARSGIPKPGNHAPHYPHRPALAPGSQRTQRLFFAISAFKFFVPRTRKKIGPSEKALAEARAFALPTFLSRARALCVLLRPLFKLRLAFLRAEVVFLPTVLRLILRIILIHFHSANRILRHELRS